MIYSTRTNKTRGQILNSEISKLSLIEQLIRKQLEKDPDLTLSRAHEKAKVEIKLIKTSKRSNAKVDQEECIGDNKVRSGKNPFKFLLFVLSIIVTLGALVFPIWYTSENGVFKSGDFLFIDSLILILFVFGAYVMVRLIQQLSLRKEVSRVDVWGTGIFCLSWMVMLGLSLSLAAELISDALYFSPLILIFWYFLYSYKHKEKMSIGTANQKLNSEFVENLKKEWFKVFLSIALVAFLIIMFSFLKTNSNNGRYQRFDDSLIIDTRTGMVYQLEYINEYYEPNFPRKNH